MKICSTHNHSKGSDGKLTPEEVIKKAISLGWRYIYFTDHYHLPKIVGYDYNNGFFSEKYIEEVKLLQEKYKDKIEICFGVELDWHELVEEWFRTESKKHDFDYVIGSIHGFSDKAGKFYSIENGKEDWIKGAKIFGGVQKYVTEYYKKTKKLVSSGIYDCVAHLDYIKVYNEKGDLFSENDDWYKKEVLEVLDLVKKKKMAIEVNAGGLRKCKATFPSTWIIKEANKRDIPLTFGLDAHWEEHYNNEIMEKLVEIAKEAGYKKIIRFKNRKKIFIDI